MSRVVESYGEEVVTTARRFVHVVEDVTAHVEAWHGGRLVHRVGGWTSVAAALRDAREKAEWFGVGPSSSMSVVVREEVRRSRVEGDRADPDFRGRALGREVVVAERYLHDAVRGELPADWRTVAFSWVLPVKFGVAADCPGEDLKNYFSQRAVRGWRPEFLYAGYGYRGMKIVSAVARPAIPGEMPKDAVPPGEAPGAKCWVVGFEGTLDVAVPQGRNPDQVICDLSAQGLDPDVDIDWERQRNRANRDRWQIWTGYPVVVLAWRRIG